MNAAAILERPYRYLFFCGSAAIIRRITWKDREHRATERRIHRARFPVVKTLDSFHLLSIPALNKSLVLKRRDESCGQLNSRDNHHIQPLSCGIL